MADPQPIHGLLHEPATVSLKKAATLPNLWDMFTTAKNPAPNSAELYKFIGIRFLNFFADKNLDSSTIMDWNKHVRAGKNPSGEPIGVLRIHKINVTVRSFLRFIKKHGFIQDDLREFVELPKLPDPKLPEIVTNEEYQSLKSYLEDRQDFQWALWMIIVGYRTGMTMCDCAQLRWGQVFLNEAGESYMDVPRHKLRRFGEKAVCRIPIVPGSDLYEWLLKLRANEPDNDGMKYVHQDCLVRYSGIEKRRAMTHSFSKIFRRAKVKGRSFASLRRTFISNLVNSGMDYALVCKITGHSNLKTLLGYVRPDRKALQDGVMKAQQYAESKIS